MNPEIDFVTLLGQAGTGKTLLTLAAGLLQTLETKLYSEIIITRVTVPVGEDIGFLPGTEEEKMTPWMGALEDNLDLPRALALVWGFARAKDLSGATRRAGLVGADHWLGLGLDHPSLGAPHPGEWRELANAREEERRQRDYPEADAARASLIGLGVVPEDGSAGSTYRAASALDRRHGLISSPLAIPDQRGEPDLVEVSVSIVSSGYPDDLVRCVRSRCV